MTTRPILVTGSHRCGSTWVGRTLALSGDVAYIEEPFHPDHRPGVCGARVTHWYEYASQGAEGPWDTALERTLAFSYCWTRELSALRSPRDVGRMLRDAGRFASLGRSKARPLLKDPIAFFSAPWIAERFASQVVLLVRHPAAFASSLKRLDWTFDFANWIDQPALMRDWLDPWADQIHAAHADGLDVIDQSALIWSVIYGVTREFQRRFPDWIVLTHEDLSRDPVPQFRKLFGQLEVPFTAEIEASLRSSTSASNPAEAPSGTAHALSRDSKANITNWKKRLDPAEVDRLRAGVEDVSRHFYGDQDW